MATMPTQVTSETDSDFVLTPEFERAISLMEESMRHTFVTGKAGTGKSTLLKRFRQKSEKKMAVLAPTGVSAVNVRGQTIHSFFNFRPDITPDAVPALRLRREQLRIYRNLEALVIDEVSMVRADLMDCMDVFLRIHGPSPDQPFGGVQLILFGDLYQLPPVVTRNDERVFRTAYASPYFFDAKVFSEVEINRVELTRIFRQKDDDFIELLGRVRDDRLGPLHLKKLNERFRPYFVPPPEQLYVYLTTTNATVDRINTEQLNELPTRECVLTGEMIGDFDEKSLPTQRDLRLKIGAQIMMLNNDSKGRWINGSLGKVTYLNEQGFGTDNIEVELETGQSVEVEPFTWDMYRFFYNDENERLESESVGSFRQYPIRLAWALTIHKSQGKTFTHVILDIGRGTFSHGQLYVALSRCTTFEGLILKKTIHSRHVLLDRKVVQFMT